MIHPRLFRTAAATLALTLAGVPVATRICGFRCDAAPPVETAGAASGPRCPAHPPRPKPATPDSRSQPCGHGHAEDGTLLTASSSVPRNGARHLETPFAPSGPACVSTPLVPCGEGFEFDRDPPRPAPAMRSPILRL
jgi:hypothetical protein